MARYIPQNFTPSPNTLDKLRKKGIFEDFLKNCVDDNFKVYWGDAKEQKLKTAKKSSWQTTYMNWAIRAHQGRVGREWEENRHRRESHGKAYKGDLFADVLDKVDKRRGKVDKIARNSGKNPLYKGESVSKSVPDDKINGGEKATVQEAQAHRQARTSDVTVRPHPDESNRAGSRPAAPALTPEEAFKQLRESGVLK